MKFMGKIDDIIFNGKILIRAENKPKLGTTVVDKHKNPLGKIKQIIGPVKKPYIIVYPNKRVKTGFGLIGTDVYILK